MMNIYHELQILSCSTVNLSYETEQLSRVKSDDPAASNEQPFQLCSTVPENGSYKVVMNGLFSFVQPFLCEKLKIHDSCGVNNLHGMPGAWGC